MIQACHAAACLNHVNGLYGPGAMLGWYLTLAGCIISWTLHPHRKSKDSIHPDFVALLAVPLTAAAQSISISRQVAKTSTTIEGNEAVLEAALKRDLASLQTCQVRATIEACSKVVYVHLFITLMVYPLPALRRLKRGVVLALVFIFCFASQVYALDYALSDIPAIRTPSAWLDGPSSFYGYAVPGALFGRDVIIWIEYTFKSRRATGPGVMESQSNRKIDPPDLMGMRIAALIVPGLVTMLQRSQGWKQQNTPLSLPPDFERILFPETPYSLGNIEQIMAAAAGATVLGFNSWSVGKLLYKERQARLLREKASQPKPRTPEIPLRKWHGRDDEADD